MKNISYLFVSAMLILTSACGKKDTPTPAGALGSWSFKSVTYNTGSDDFSAGANGETMYAYTGSGYSASGGEINIGFSATGIPPAGTYTVANNTGYNAGQVFIALSNDSSSYSTTNLTNTSIVTVTVVGGKVNITGSGIKLLNNANFADSSSTVSFNITQQ